MKVLKKDKSIKEAKSKNLTTLEKETIKPEIESKVETTEIKRKLFQKKEVDKTENIVSIELNKDNNLSNNIEEIKQEYLDKELDYINLLFEDAQHDEDFYQLKMSEEQYDKWLGRKTLSFEDLDDFNKQFKEIDFVEDYFDKDSHSD